jgi:hypothetical protein
LKPSIDRNCALRFSINNEQSRISNDHLRKKEDSMCPACIANAALVAGSVMSTGGIAALVAKVVRSKKSRNDNSKKDDGKEK